MIIPDHFPGMMGKRFHARILYGLFVCGIGGTIEGDNPLYRFYENKIAIFSMVASVMAPTGRGDFVYLMLWVF